MDERMRGEVMSKVFLFNLIRNFNILLNKKTPGVIALGGGAFLNKKLQKRMRSF